jgi:hypothetical protein
MSITDYLIDSTLVLLVLLQIRERELTTRAILRPLIIVGIAVANYLHGIPTAGCWPPPGRARLRPNVKRIGITLTN